MRRGAGLGAAASGHRGKASGVSALCAVIGSMCGFADGGLAVQYDYRSVSHARVWLVQG
jgi:hypothetical protein